MNFAFNSEPSFYLSSHPLCIGSGTAPNRDAVSDHCRPATGSGDPCNNCNSSSGAAEADTAASCDNCFSPNPSLWRAEPSPGPANLGSTKSASKGANEDTYSQIKGTHQTELN